MIKAATIKRQFSYGLYKIQMNNQLKPKKKTNVLHLYNRFNKQRVQKNNKIKNKLNKKCCFLNLSFIISPQIT